LLEIVWPMPFLPAPWLGAPIYLAFSLLQLGIAICMASLWLIGTLIAAVAIMAWVVIPREEQYLESRFGAQYLEYKASVRRWL
jgi:protein-S-isoprenylcysteine O-methyltransferase Ste14